MIWHEIMTAQDKLLGDVFHLYDQLFPVEVREPHYVLTRSLQASELDRSQSFLFLVGKLQDKVISFATAHYFSEVNTGFIVYIGTDPAYQKLGIGSQTLQKTQDRMQELAKLAGYKSLRSMVLEVEQIEQMAIQFEREEGIQRNHFFAKNGYNHLPQVSYVQPPLHAHESAIPLNLWAKVMGGQDLAHRELMGIIHTMYKKKYGLLNQIPEDILYDCLQIMGIHETIPRV